LNKVNLRDKFRKIRSNISSSRRAEAEELCFAFLMSNLPHEARVLSFASKQEEIDLWQINKLLVEEGRLLLPKVVEDHLDCYKISSLEGLILSPYSILEPDPLICKKASFDQIDVVLVPALCFDDLSSRIGYGKGHYDRLLPLLKKENPDIFSWGIGFKEQRSDVTIETDFHDQTLDQVFLF
jgi:5-formyltetrahydrofolate cyclo-ligase